MEARIFSLCRPFLLTHSWVNASIPRLSDRKICVPVQSPNLQITWITCKVNAHIFSFADRKVGVCLQSNVHVTVELCTGLICISKQKAGLSKKKLYDKTLKVSWNFSENTPTWETENISKYVILNEYYQTACITVIKQFDWKFDYLIVHTTVDNTTEGAKFPHTVKPVIVATCQ